jgi:hypothetical protein
MNLRKGMSTSNATEPQRQPPRIVMSVIPNAVVPVRLDFVRVSGGVCYLVPQIFGGLRANESYES